MIQVSHETPKCYLEDSKQFNDYQYALVHLLENNLSYRMHFIKCREEGIPIYLDNSLHELGTAIGGEVLLKWVDVLKPKNIFVPDVWEDKNASVVNAREWSKIDLPEGVEKVAVVQATSILEASLCYQAYKDMGYKKIAFSYGAKYFNEVFHHPNIHFGKALGRLLMINTLYKNGIICSSDKVHLLGASIPQEFGWYQGLPFIESLDTSNPVMSALEGIKYNKYGLMEKPKSNMNNHFNIEYSKSTLKLILHNVEKFKTINNLI